MLNEYDDYKDSMTYDEYLRCSVLSCVNSIEYLMNIDTGMNDQIYNIILSNLKRIKINLTEMEKESA